jgi:hypothetical protein
LRGFEGEGDQGAFCFPDNLRHRLLERGEHSGLQLHQLSPLLD